MLKFGLHLGCVVLVMFSLQTQAQESEDGKFSLGLYAGGIIDYAIVEFGDDHDEDDSTIEFGIAVGYQASTRIRAELEVGIQRGNDTTISIRDSDGETYLRPDSLDGNVYLSLNFIYTPQVWGLNFQPFVGLGVGIQWEDIPRVYRSHVEPRGEIVFHDKSEASFRNMLTLGAEFDVTESFILGGSVRYTNSESVVTTFGINLRLKLNGIG